MPNAISTLEKLSKDPVFIYYVLEEFQDQKRGELFWKFPISVGYAESLLDNPSSTYRLGVRVEIRKILARYGLL